jgi:hypothetical protein
MRHTLLAVVALLAANVALGQATKPSPLPPADKDGFIPIFNGTDLAGWTNTAGGAPGAGWVVQDGALVLDKKGGGNLWTAHRFGDFILDMEFKTEGNSGILLRCDKPGNYIQTCIEVQVLSPTATPNKNSCGAIYDCLAPTKEASKKGEWNRIVITCKNNLITIEINSDKIIEMDLDKWTEANKNPDGTKNKFNKPLKEFKREGHIGVQDHGAKVSYRNIKLKPLAN